MNKVYRSVWNESTRTWVAAEESARGKTKGGVKRSRGAVAAAAVVVAATFSVWAPAALADSQVEMGVDSVAENAAVDTRLSSGSSENDMRSAFELADEEEVRKRARQAQQKQLLMASLNPAGPSRGAAPVGMADNVKEPFVKETMLTQAELIDMMQRQKSSSQLGKDVVVWGDSVAIGDSANAMIGAGMGTDQDGTAIGHASKTGYEGSALGFGTTALGKKSAAVGKYANATGENAVAIGSNGIAKDDNSIVLGAESVAEDEKYRGGERVLSLGKKDNSLKTRVLHVADAMDDTDAATYGQVKSELAKRLDDQSVFFGKSAKATGARTTSIGVDSTASGQSAIAIGDSARANGIGAIAIGRGSIANKDETVSFGFQKGDKLSGTEGGLTAGITQTRELVNVSQGTQDHSVVTLSQLKKLAAEISEDIKFDDNGNSTDVVYKSQSGSHASLRGAVENINGVVTANKQAIANATQALADKVTKAQLTQAQETIKAELKQIAGENTSGQIMITSSDKNHKAEVGKNSDNSIAIGSDAKVLDNSDYAMALGAQSKAKGQGAMVQGASARAEGIGALATGFEAKAIGDGALAFGNGAKAYVEDANNKDENDLPVLNPVKSATAIGQNAHAAAEQALAIGMEAKALQAGSVAIGANSTTARANTFAVGGTGVDQQRQVVNVAAGTLANDATNVEQIKKLVGAKDLTFKANGDIEKLTLDESNKQSLAGQLGAGTSGAIATKGSKGAARADGINSVAVGAGSVALAVNEFSVGSGSIKRIVRNVAN
uniref:ESPR-type extended signal peptide-containing protein n=1 Tax=Burkholderia ambifaria TaxID=152480 RepID=UPI001ABAAA9D